MYLKYFLSRDKYMTIYVYLHFMKMSSEHDNKFLFQFWNDMIY